jgi:hypothetical protein
MGSATLTFDSITITNKRSDTKHNDNDWMTIVWYVNANHQLTKVLPLAKADGDTSLDSGSVIAPLSSTVPCTDDDVVTATFVVVNLGSSDAAEQRAKAEEIGKQVAKGVADAYVRIAAYFVKEGVPAGEIFSRGIDELRPVIVDSVGAAYDDIVKPAIEALLHLLGAPPDCNGEVLQDIAVFSSTSVYPITNVPPPYDKVRSPHDCGHDPVTSVIFTQDRQFFVGSFPTTPAPKTECAPVHDQNDDLWLGSWAEDPGTRYPIIRVSVERSRRASALYSVEIVERVDPVHDIVYETGADPVSMHVKKVIPYLDNVFGTVRPWVAHGVAPGSAHVVNHPIIRHDEQLGSARRQHAAVADRPVHEPAFALRWSRPIVGTPITSHAHPFLGAANVVGVGGELIDTADAIDLPDRGVRLCLYEIRQNGTAIAHAIRYLRAESLSYTRADVMLFHWSPTA